MGIVARQKTFARCNFYPKTLCAGSFFLYSYFNIIYIYMFLLSMLLFVFFRFLLLNLYIFFSNRFIFIITVKPDPKSWSIILFLLILV